MKRLFSITISELVSVCKMIKDSLVRDIADFLEYKPKYITAFVTALEGRIEELTDLVENKIKIGEVTKLTKKLYETADKFRQLLTNIEGYVVDADGAEESELTVGLANFRFKQAREAIGEKDIDLAVIELQTVWKLMDDNFAVLEPFGYKEATHTDFEAKVADIDKQNTDRNKKVEEKEAMVQANLAFLNAIYKDTMKIAEDGKRIYKFTDKQKTRDYTLNVLIKRISNVPVDNAQDEPPVS